MGMSAFSWSGKDIIFQVLHISRFRPSSPVSWDGHRVGLGPLATEITTPSHIFLKFTLIPIDIDDDTLDPDTCRHHTIFRCFDDIQLGERTKDEIHRSK